MQDKTVSAWNYYHSGTKSIEILKDNTLQKIYFWCKDQVGRCQNKFCKVPIDFSLVIENLTLIIVL